MLETAVKQAEEFGVQKVGSWGGGKDLRYDWSYLESEGTAESPRNTATLLLDFFKVPFLLTILR